jgi:hypothetical protein
VLSQQPDPTQITPEEVRDDFDLPRLVRTRRGLRYASAAAGGTGAHRPSED